MQALNIHSKIVSDYKDYLKSFNIIRDDRIRRVVDDAFKDDQYIPEPLIQFNPSYKRAADFKELEKEGVLHPELKRVFGGFRLFKHQEEAIRLGAQNQSFVVTSGTGSGKSLTFLGAIFNYIFKNNPGPGVKAVLVYPMNALINSQEEEIQKYADNYGENFPITFRKYTGQEGEKERLEVENNPPDILLTNYMMLELLLTRAREKYMRDSFAYNLRFLVFDELHTYRGRQGADIAMLIRRLRAICQNEIKCVGTSATMVSGDDPANSKQLVAEFASLIFAENISSSQVVDETLETTTNFKGSLPGSFDLQESIHQPIDKNSDQEVFRNHPLAIWLENKIALAKTDAGTIRRGRPLPLREIIEQLAKDAVESDIEKCKQALISLFEWSELLNIKYLDQKISFLPFKIHQFISQTGNVYVTLENRTNRKITLTDGMYIKEESGEEKTLFPVLFSRYSGFDFICVKKNFTEQKLEPREITELPEKITKDDLKGNKELGTKKRVLTEHDFEAGYLLIPEPGEELWSDEMITTLPDTWWKIKHGDTVVDNFYEFRLPQKIFYNKQGSFSSEPADGLDQTGWFVAAPLYFDPSAGIVFDSRTNENTKLMRVGNVGKSTATTIATFSILKSQQQQKVPKEIQKVLSFTDNRQDASLQAGHFNDFLMIGRLRSAIYHALKSAENSQLKIEHIADAVYNKLGIQETEYARNPGDADWADLENVKAIKDFLTVRILYDLRRGWRFNTPNLEQCALLKIDYERLDELSQTEKFFENDQLLKHLSPDERYIFLLHFLNYFRTAFAFDYYKLDPGNIRSLEERLKQRLNSEKEWSLSEDEHLEIPALLIYRSPGRTDKSTFTQSIGPNSNLAKYIKRIFLRHGMAPIKGESLAAYIGDLCAFLKGKHFLSVREIKGDKGSVKAYSLRVENIIWKLGDGQEVLT
ncbi:MAG: DEAD/DEAH box helicase, partial [Syntrophaceae bacterium]|nr:DEAD/DEAH box helicase [Syntrophaceae bacterium]